MSDTVRCSVIIPSYNSEKTIAACLTSVLAQDFAEPYEVIVVDSSNDATPQIVREQFPQVQLIRREQRTGSGTARNLGVQAARGEILAFTDSDCVVKRDWLRRLYEAHQQYPEYAAIGGAITNGNPESLISWAGYLTEFNESLPRGVSKEVQHVPTGNISFKRYVFERYGLFPGDEAIQGIDRLFNHKIRQGGERILFIPDIQVAHSQRTGLGEFLRHQFSIGRATVQIMRRTDYPGASIIKHRLLATLLLPGFFLAKVCFSSYRFLRWWPTAFLRKPALLPCFVMGVVWWLTGLAYQLYQDEGEGGT